MPHFDGLTLEQLKVKAEFYLGSAVRAEAEVERLQKAEALSQSILKSHAKHRRQLRKKHKQALEVFRKTKLELQEARQQLREAYEFIAAEIGIEDSPKGQEVLEAIRNTNGVWETQPKEK